ncbi:hypothetical protein VTJ04DRAFT_9489 [Mycothermus thermophilus]|uniref:uncharacterized protein n=1 Tax=Humicola insolens TaxID=85995 RepID=UPI003743E42C
MAAKQDAVDLADGPESPSPAALTSTSPSHTASETTSPASQRSPLLSLTLSEQAFTPLSMDMSDYGSAPDDAQGKTSPAPQEGDRLLRTARSMEQLRRHANISRSSTSSTVPASAGAGNNIVSVMVESFEALAAKMANDNLGYQLLRSRSAAGRPPAVTSHPSTISPSPSPSPSLAAAKELASAPSADAGLGAVVDPTPTSPVAAQTDHTTVPSTAPETPKPDATAPDSKPDQPLNDVALASPSSPDLDSPQEAVLTSVAGTSLSHPTPETNKLSQAGSFLNNIAALEATAERMAQMNSIEDAIREEHNELKRSESRRSSILRARAASVASETQRSVASRKSSILETNNAARSGGYSQGGFVMNPYNSPSAVSGRLRSGSKASSSGVPGNIPEDAAVEGEASTEDFIPEYRYLPRHGPGKASTRSVASRLSLVQIAEHEDPTSLTKEALDEAERAEAAGETSDIDENIRAKAHQFIEAEFADFVNEIDLVQQQPAPGNEPTGDMSPRLQLHQPDNYQPYGQHHDVEHQRPLTSASVTTFEQARDAFGDFDGVHCDPETVDFPPRRAVQVHEPPQPPRNSLGQRPTSYIDPATGQQMMYYPAPVPAMLNLPPKLSKKPKRQSRMPQALAAAPPRASHESRSIWLPDPTRSLRKGNEGAPYMGELLDGVDVSDLDHPPLQGGAPTHARQPSEASTIHGSAPEQREIRKPPRLTDADKRKSSLPPQLRASAFFELPREAPKIEATDGAATSVLDSLLDASAVAPVNAFTDHLYAGKLGAEVYGPEKKRKKKPATPVTEMDDKVKRKTLVKRNSSGNLLEPSADGDKPKRKTLVKRHSSGDLLDKEKEGEKKRKSRLSLFPHKRKDDSDDDSDDGRSQTSDRSRDNASPNQLAPGPDEQSEESDDDEPVYQGPPTTLLAELQLRKQRNKMRTQGIHYQTAGGIRSTLLELDAVAEMERKARTGKRVTLAWEDPAAIAHKDSDEDEDVPLGMLAVAKSTGAGNRATMDMNGLIHELHRPPGLLEQREMEENEPLSRRRDRLQGRASQQLLPTTLSSIQNRMSQMPVGGLGTRSQSRLTLMLQPSASNGGSRTDSMMGGSSRPGDKADGEDDSEDEGETLAARKARLAAENPLPPPRPVSGAFSAELLKEFNPDDEDGDKKNGGQHKPNEDEPAVAEEEETLGQRRRRLQREREAREREMAYSSLTRAATPEPNVAMNGAAVNLPIRPVTAGGAVPATTATASARGPVPLSSLLSAHPAGGFNFNPQLQPQQPQPSRLSMIPQPTPQMSVMGLTMDPREAARLQREAEAERRQREMEAKLAAHRAQIPANLTAPGIGAKPGGGFMGGVFNDGLGGGVAMSGAVPASATAGFIGQQRASMLPASASMGGMLGAGGYGGVVYTPDVAVGPAGAAAAAGLYGAGPGGMQTPGHIDMVERWRQGVMP